MRRRVAIAVVAGSLATLALALTVACFGSGCSSVAAVGYYAQSVRGHLNLIQAARPVSSWLADPDTPPRLRSRLELAERIRDFSVAELKEPDNASYRRYADLGRSAAVWNVVAAPELSLRAKTWCFVVVGCVAYRGYYDRAEAEQLAAALRGEGLDVAVYPVPAYSTLGRLPPFDWLADPLLNTFIDNADVELARLVFHELAHQVAFAPGDTEFNESFATAVETIGGERWLRANGDVAARREAAARDIRRDDFRALTRRTRERLATIYAGADDDATKRLKKAEALAALRAEHAALKAGAWAGYSGYDAWIARANNGGFALLASYTALVPEFVGLFERSDGDFERWYAEVRRIAALPTPAERRAALGG